MRKTSDYENDYIALAQRVVARFSEEEIRAILVQDYAASAARQALAQRVVACFSEEEIRAILVQDYTVNYFQHPDAYDDDLNMVETEEQDT